MVVFLDNQRAAQYRHPPSWRKDRVAPPSNESAPFAVALAIFAVALATYCHGVSTHFLLARAFTFIKMVRHRRLHK